MSTPSALLLIALAFTSVAGAECTAVSGPATAALVELYTSEGCSSCPPADRFLSRLPESPNLVPLALHVDYWDYLGWHDPFAMPEFASRQRWLAQAGGVQAVYTPQIFVSGKDVSWRGGEFSAALRRINNRPARAVLRIAMARAGPGRLAVSADATIAPGSAVDSRSLLFAAVTENALVSQVHAGENRGERLTHDHVVRQWIGPLLFSNKGVASLRKDIALAPRWNPANLRLVAFVQDSSTGEVLQALSCAEPWSARP